MLLVEVDFFRMDSFDVWLGVRWARLGVRWKTDDLSQLPNLVICNCSKNSESLFFTNFRHGHYAPTHQTAMDLGLVLAQPGGESSLTASNEPIAAPHSIVHRVRQPLTDGSSCNSIQAAYGQSPGSLPNSRLHAFPNEQIHHATNFDFPLPWYTSKIYRDTNEREIGVHFLYSTSLACDLWSQTRACLFLTSLRRDQNLSCHGHSFFSLFRRSHQMLYRAFVYRHQARRITNLRRTKKRKGQKFLGMNPERVPASINVHSEPSS